MKKIITFFFAVVILSNAVIASAFAGTFGRTFGTPDEYRLNAVIAVDGGYVIAGSVKTGEIRTRTNEETKKEEEIIVYEGYFAKTDSNGEDIIWETRVNIDSVNPEDGVTVDVLEFYDIVQTKSGGYVAVGLASGVKQEVDTEVTPVSILGMKTMSGEGKKSVAFKDTAVAIEVDSNGVKLRGDAKASESRPLSKHNTVVVNGNDIIIAGNYDGKGQMVLVGPEATNLGGMNRLSAKDVHDYNVLKVHNNKYYVAGECDDGLYLAVMDKTFKVLEEVKGEFRDLNLGENHTFCITDFEVVGENEIVMVGNDTAEGGMLLPAVVKANIKTKALTIIQYNLDNYTAATFRKIVRAGNDYYLLADVENPQTLWGKYLVKTPVNFSTAKCHSYTGTDFQNDVLINDMIEDKGNIVGVGAILDAFALPDVNQGFSSETNGAIAVLAGAPYTTITDNFDEIAISKSYEGNGVPVEDVGPAAGKDDPNSGDGSGTSTQGGVVEEKVENPKTGDMNLALIIITTIIAIPTIYILIKKKNKTGTNR